MNRPVLLRPEAECDIAAIFTELEESQVGAGAHFAAELRKSLEAVEAMAEVPVGMRLRRFPYVVYFIANDDRAEVLAVMHAHSRAK